MLDILQAVLANGDVVKTASRARKSAAGFVFLSFLFILPPQTLFINSIVDLFSLSLNYCYLPSHLFLIYRYGCAYRCIYFILLFPRISLCLVKS